MRSGIDGVPENCLQTTAPQPESEGYTPTVELVHPKQEEVREETPAEEEARVFAKLKELKSDTEEKDETDE